MNKNYSVDDVKAYVENLLGRDVDVKVNRGRNRIKRYVGKVSETHSNVFVIEIADDILDRISCSYIDMICGEIALTEHTYG
ncbi:MAG: Veg family protein [Corallococcus sp.]|nr:Veg family protein [Corallococcus sp.]